MKRCAWLGDSLKDDLGIGLMRQTVLQLFVFLPFFLAASGTVYAIDVSSCSMISSPGSYQLAANLTGAPLTVAYSTVTRACIIIAADDVDFSCNGFNITNNVTLDATAIAINGSAGASRDNITIRDCPNINDYEQLLYVLEANNSFVSDIGGNVTGSGVYLYPAYNSEIRDITMASTTGLGYGLYIRGSSYITARNIDVSGFTASGSGFDFYLDHNITLINNTIHGNRYGLNMWAVSDSEFRENTVYMNDRFGFYIYATISGINVTNNTVYGNGQDGIRMRTNVINCNFNDNYIHHNNDSGFYIDTSATYNNVTNNRIYNNVDYGIRVFTGGDNNRFTDNTLYGNRLNAIQVQTGDGNVFTGNTVENVTSGSGIYVYAGADNSTFTDNMVSGASQYGIYIWDSNNTVLTNNEFYNNNLDDLYLRVGATPITYSATDLKIGSTSGDEFIVFDITDVIEANSQYKIEYAAAGSTPENRTSFRNKLVNISTILGTPSIDSISFTWLASETTGYDESKFELWKWNSSANWTLLDNVPDTLNHKFTLTNLVPASFYGIFEGPGPAVANGTAQLYAANITNATALARWLDNTTASSIATEGGNITAVNLSGSSLTDRWAGYYGNLTGSIYLTDNVSGIPQYIYAWAWNSSFGGVVCASTNSTLGVISISAATGANIDTAWGFPPAAADSGTNTFNETNCTMAIGATAIANTSFADTGQPGGFRTCVYTMNAAGPAKADMIFCSPVQYNGSIYNGETGDFELIIPTAYGSGAYETYYFYANLD